MTDSPETILKRLDEIESHIQTNPRSTGGATWLCVKLRAALQDTIRMNYLATRVYVTDSRGSQEPIAQIGEGNVHRNLRDAIDSALRSSPEGR